MIAATKSTCARRFHTLLHALLGCTIAASACNGPREELRADVVGCWRFSGMADEPRPNLILLDSSASPFASKRGERVVLRLDSLGHVVTSGSDVLPLVDRWSADPRGDNIRIFLSNQFYGSHSELELSAQAHRSDTMRGRSQAFTDVYLESAYPQRPVSATRVACPVPPDTTAGA